MAVSQENFPARKRRPSAGAFLSPGYSDQKLPASLFLLSQDISSVQPLKILLNKSSSSVIRKSRLISIVFEDLVSTQVNVLSPSAALCFEELYIVLQRTKILLEDCSRCSKMWLLTQIQSFSSSFHQLIAEFSTLLDIFPSTEMKLNEDVEELLYLIKRQCSDQADCVDYGAEDLRAEVLKMLENIKREIVPDRINLSEIFKALDLNDCTSCTNEIESLEDEVQNQKDDKSKADAIALIGLVRYAKCVLYGASTPRNNRRLRQTNEVNIPADFRCPVSLDLMRDPVVVTTGQTYDRPSICQWIESGHDTCPKTGQILANTQLIPNLALKNLIAMWCREQRIPFEATENFNTKPNGGAFNKTALEAVKMTASFLVNNLTASQTAESINRVVHELRVLAKTDSDSRACIAEAGALPLLVMLLGSEHPNVQVNAVTTILNLSILEANKTRIMETDGVLNGVIEVLRSGATWEAKGNAAATIFSLTGVHAHRKKLGKKTRVVKALLDLARLGPTSPRRDAMMAILNLAGDREAVGKLIEGGVVDIIGGELTESLSEEAVAVLEVVMKRGGLLAVAAAYHGNLVKRLTTVLREGSDRARESAAATLVIICRRGGSEMVAEVAAISGIERVVWEIMGSGTRRGRRKAATLLRVLRRWAAGLVGEQHSTLTVVDTALTRILLPA